MRVKICGITTLDDAMTAIDAGADALGFVFYPPSPRYIAPETAADIIRSLPPFVEKVGLFVNESAKSINDISERSQITLAQLHFDIDDLLLNELNIPYLRVVRAGSKKDALLHHDEYRIVDAYCEEYGGMGKRLNLEWFEDMDCSKIILAGGLSPDNVEECLHYGFYALDVSSGVEISKGVKDPKKVSVFIQKAKAG
ncbi:MAG: N-(5'-phosphoribosyl)anthranilate isomerase [Helicobacteraceae bacterium 4484_230]|nr:MAG: N-(5'-phosphoribosyl)anthranilate isomerase [Helicobacteraceae bacterium 4484_230]